MADLMGSPDGAYSYSTSFIYPSDMEGVAGMVIRETSTYDDITPQEVEDGEPGTLTRIVMHEALRWNGSALVPGDAPPSKRRYLMVLD